MCVCVFVCAFLEEICYVEGTVGVSRIPVVSMSDS